MGGSARPADRASSRAVRAAGRTAAAVAAGFVLQFAAAQLAIHHMDRAIRVPNLRPARSASPAHRWAMAALDGWPARPDLEVVWEGLGWRHTSQNLTRDAPGGMTAFWAQAEGRAGLPFHSVRRVRATQYSFDRGTARRAEGVWQVAVPWLGPLEIVHGSLPVGALVNTAVFAVPAWIACGLPARWRRSREARRGRCVRCRYDLRGLTGACPECGLARGPGRP